MQCPACRHFYLKPVRLEAGLPALCCTKCHGALIALVTYRVWAEALPPATTENHISEVTDNKKALQCPKCQRLMMKYRVGNGVDNRVDLCTHCDEAWLDAGEWSLLKQLQLHGKLASITTEPWQRRVREAEREKTVAATFEKQLGADDWQRLQEIKRWLEGHPRKQDLRRYLLRE